MQFIESGGKKPTKATKATRPDEDIVIASIAETLRESRTGAPIEGLERRYGHKIVHAALSRHQRELQRQVKRAHADWMKRWRHPGVRYAGEVHITHKAKLIRLLIYPCPRCVKDDLKRENMRANQ